MIYNILHFILAIIPVFYGLIFSKNWLDIYYIYGIVIVAIHWTILKGECFITLIYKLKKNPNYKMGSNTESSDMTNILGKKYSGYVFILLKIFAFIKIISFYIVFKRNNIKYSELICFIFLLYTIETHNHFIFFILFIIILFNLKK
jgi:hypothetical protein